MEDDDAWLAREAAALFDARDRILEHIDANALVRAGHDDLAQILMRFLPIDHSGIIDELGETPADQPGPGLVRYAFPSLTALYAIMPRVYRLGVSLPDGPLDEYREAVRDLPKTTEAERLIIQRVGQDIFRDRLMDYWQGRCPLTGITDPALLRASHIIAWADCETDAERLDVHNGLLLSALWDAAFGRYMVTFDNEGRPQFSPELSEAARSELRCPQAGVGFCRLHPP